MNDAQETGLAVRSATTDMAVSRQAQEVQAAMVMAKRFPRDEFQAIERIKQSCRRPGLASVACYEYPRGGTKVEGPSIRLAEAMAQAWGNLDYGLIELEQNLEKGESSIMAFCWDLETNTRQTKMFQVPHTRYSKAKGNTKLSDPRDIYEMIANQGARRLRSCILGVIPGDVQDVAIEECDKTLTGKNTKPIRERITSMLDLFESVAVSKADIEGQIQHPIDSCTERELLKLAKIYNSMKDGIGKKIDFFKTASETMKKPEAKKPAAKKETPKQEPEDKLPMDNGATTPVNEALSDQLSQLESEATDEVFKKTREIAGVDEAEDPLLMDDAKIKELIQLYGASK